jgi:hypothetical protein
VMGKLGSSLFCWPLPEGPCMLEVVRVGLASWAAEPLERETMSILRTKIAVSTVAVALVVVRQLRPGFLDTTDLVVVGVAMLPWLTALIKSAELPGGVKVEFQEVADAMEKAAGDSTAPPMESVNIPAGDPNLALVAIRIEIERRVRELGKLHGADVRRPLMLVFRDLQAKGVLKEAVLSGLQELVTFGNQAAHGAIVDPAAAHWAAQYGPVVIGELERLLAIARNDSGESAAA